MSRESEWITEEQVSLWNDLDDAIRRAINGQWSMAASNVARRIVGAARTVGATPHGEVPWPLVAGGVYEAVLTAGGLAAVLPDAAEWERLDDLMAEHGGRRVEIMGHYAGTVAAIQSPRETAWINDASPPAAPVVEGIIT